MFWTQTSPKVRACIVFAAAVGSTAFSTLTILTILFLTGWLRKALRSLPSPLPTCLIQNTSSEFKSLLTFRSWVDDLPFYVLASTYFEMFNYTYLPRGKVARISLYRALSMVVIFFSWKKSKAVATIPHLKPPPITKEWLTSTMSQGYGVYSCRFVCTRRTIFASQ